MSKKKDWISLGEAYEDVFSRVVVNEEVPAGEVGAAPLELSLIHISEPTRP